ncbi:SigE family RNA polymerase sigma factor [Streptomyces alkaliphilus]|uniref:SigE family RNA polymerase sigma factor n=1 Tax=Streptomyces alkaliphilus TaxID=1472722 RepID=A0A7W3Y4B3_9ACTN|nr:SigE family RNA polymerase sigma factor [Streptomyces alkaliphilus]
MTTPGSTPPVTPLTFSAYVRARGPVLLRTARSLTPNPNDAEDLLQTALTKTFVAWDRIEDRRALDGYVRRALINTRTSQWRRRRVDEHPVDELPEPEPAPETDPAERQALREAMWRAVLRLPPRQRAMVVLRYYEDLSEARTAEVLGVSVGTVKSAVSRAMSRLRMDARLAALAAPEGSAESAGATETTGAEILPGPPLATGRRRGARGGTVGRGPATLVARAA